MKLFFFTHAQRDLYLCFSVLTEGITILNIFILRIYFQINDSKFIMCIAFSAFYSLF